MRIFDISQELFDKYLIAKHAAAISDAVLATAMAETEAPADAYTKEWNINGEKAVLSVKKN